MAKRLGTMTIEIHRQPMTYTLFDDGRATCTHVANGTPSASSGRGKIKDPMARFGREQFTVFLCAACIAKYRKK